MPRSPGPKAPAFPLATVLVVPYPPSSNHLWTPVIRYTQRRKPYARLVLSPLAEDYYRLGAWEVLSQRTQPSCWPYTVPLRVTVIRIPPDDGHVRDKHNTTKMLWDLLEKAQVIANDRLIEEEHYYPLPPHGPGRIHIVLEPLRPEERHTYGLDHPDWRTRARRALPPA
jgi:Holliday junction resolvase RusA-like endonuclease